MTTVGNAVAKQSATKIIEQYEGDFASVLPTHIKPQTWVRLTTSVFRTDKNLANILQNNPGSVLAALLDAARLGLDVGDTYHLVPFGKEVVGISDYTGLIELMYRAGAVASVKAEIVYSGDHFEFTTDMQRPIHRPDWFAEDRGEIIGAYAYADMRDGSVSRVVVRSKAEIERVRSSSPSGKSNSSPWNKWYDRMALKTVVRELAKFVPTSPEFIREQLRAAHEVANEQHAEPKITHAPVTEDGEHIDPVTGEVSSDAPEQVVDAELVDDWPDTPEVKS